MTLLAAGVDVAGTTPVAMPMRTRSPATGTPAEPPCAPDGPCASPSRFRSDGRCDMAECALRCGAVGGGGEAFADSDGDIGGVGGNAALLPVRSS
eukprot:363963-Chlamydomonas_euryale.AAC.1